MQELRQAAALAPEKREIHAILAKALQAKGLTIEAEQEMQKAQEGSPRER